MKLVTIQTMSAYRSLLEKGYLIADMQFINLPKYGVPYDYVVGKMKDIDNPFNAKYPLWAWVQYGKIASPPSNKLLGFFKKNDEQVVRITFEKPENQVLISDYVKYHFMLTNEYLPENIEDYQSFQKILLEKGVSKEDLLAFVRRDKYDKFRNDEDFQFVNEKIKNSYERIFSSLGDFKQGTVWNIDKEEILKVEFIDRDRCVRKKIVDYRKMHIKALKKR